MGTLGQSGLPPTSTTEARGGPVGGRWEPRGGPRKPRRTGRMPTWVAVFWCYLAFAPIFLDPPRSASEALFQSAFCLVTAANLCAGLVADRDHARRRGFRTMYAWDWGALVLSAIGGGGALLLAVRSWREETFGVLMGVFALLLALLAAMRRGLPREQPPPAEVARVFE